VVNGGKLGVKGLTLPAKPDAFATLLTGDARFFVARARPY